MLHLRLALIPVCLLTPWIVGCGGGQESPPTASTAPSGANDASGAGHTPVTGVSQSSTADPASSSSATAAITASISSPAGDSVDNSAASVTSDAAAENADDEATSILKKIQQMRIAAVPADLEQARVTRRERNETIVELATSVLRLTMDDESRQLQFRQAIGQLLEARFQLALAGTTEDIEAFYADIQTLDAHDPESVAAAEAIYYAARFAHTKAALLGKTQPEWFETLSRWAREFSDRFPGQQHRAVTLLFGAARSCELHALTATDAALSQRLMTESKLCYNALAERFPQTPQGQESTAVLRRMAVTGQQLSQFSGPTIDGGLVAAEDFVNKPTLIYFWSSEDAEFVEVMLPALQKVHTQAGSERLRIVGVPLDEEEPQLEAFMEKHPVPGQQIFYPTPEQRSWNSPLVRFWGISKSPSLWLIDANGKVVSTTLTVPELVPALQKLFRQPR